MTYESRQIKTDERRCRRFLAGIRLQKRDEKTKTIHLPPSNTYMPTYIPKDTKIVGDGDV